MIKKVGLLILLASLSCEEPPAITSNNNPFPNSGSAGSGIKDRLASATWTWKGVEVGKEEDVEHQNEAEKIFSGVRLDFHYNPINGMSGRFRYRMNDGRNLIGLWDLDEDHNTISLVFEENWGSPILTRPNTALFDITQITTEKLEMRFTEYFQYEKAVLVFVH